MKTIDLTLFDDDGFIIKTKGSEYTITFMDSVNELKFLNCQQDVIKKARDFSLLEYQDVQRWQRLIINVVNAQTEYRENKIDESQITSLTPMQTIAIMMGFSNWLNKRSQIIYQAFDEETKKDIKELENEVKKKELNRALQESGQ